jgi:hypothetical protein
MTDDDTLFQSPTLATTADLSVVDGIATVEARTTDRDLRLTVPVSAGEVSVALDTETARELGEALIAGADELEERDGATTDPPEAGVDD